MRNRLPLLAILAALACAGPAQAATFTVNTTGDGVSGNPCNTGAPGCTLRDAVIAANADSVADTIVVPAGTYQLTIAPSGEPNAAAGDLNILQPVTIQGAGAGSTTVEIPGHVDRAFRVDTSTGTVTISDLTITGGQSVSGPFGGGAIESEGAGAAVIQRTILTGNGSSNGGAVDYESTSGTLTIRDTAIFGNTSTFDGGGMNSDAPGTTTTITGTTFSGNTASNRGGGLWQDGDANIVNSTFSGNTASGATGGGGISVQFGTTSLTNVTVASNIAPVGGGLVNNIAGLNVNNSIVANNSGGNCNPTPNQLPTSQGNNVVSDGTCSFVQPGDKQNTDPQLGPLASNGGPTQTHALPASSPAVDAAGNGTCPASDQRGQARPFDGNFDGSLVCDAGAFELTAGPPAVTTGAASAVSTTHATLTGSVNPSGVPASAHFEYGTSTVYGSSTPASSIGAGSSAQGVSSAITGLAPGTVYHYRLVASGPGGTLDGADATFQTAALPAGGPPPPTIGVTANLVPVSGVVFYALPLKGSKARSASGAAKGALRGFGPYIRLTAATQIPIGALVKTKAGVVQLLTATNAAHATQSGQFSKGTFIVKQGGKRPLTTMVMAGSNLNACSRLPSGGAAKTVLPARRRRSRSLFSNVHGRFRTRGRNSTATVRGTAFLVKDTCEGTLTKVRRGMVRVRDLTLRKNVTVKAGKRYFARAPKKRRR